MSLTSSEGKHWSNNDEPGPVKDQSMSYGRILTKEPFKQQPLSTFCSTTGGACVTRTAQHSSLRPRLEGETYSAQFNSCPHWLPHLYVYR